MTLNEKMQKIRQTSTLGSLAQYPKTEKAKDLKELWEKVIKPTLPDKSVVIQWHKLLMKYVNQDNAVFTLRAFSSRRGFLNKVYIDDQESFGTFYTDNSVPVYFYSLAKDGFVPSLAELNDALINKLTFPYGYFSNTDGSQFVAYPKGNNPEINKKGYKLAHIFSAGENYSSDAGYKSITDFCNSVFPKDATDKWENQILQSGQHFRPIKFGDADEAKKAREFAIAHFIRSVHPLNYFLVPNKANRRDEASGIIKTNIYWHDPVTRQERDEIGEYPALIEYVAAKIKSEYENVIGSSGESIYDEFLKLIFHEKNCVDPKGNNVQIDAEYAIGIWQKKTNSTSAPANTSMKTKSVSNPVTTQNKKLNEFKDFEEFAKKNGVSNPSGYSSHIRKIMRELKIKTLSRLNEQIDETIERCTKKINTSSNKKEKKNYSDHRAVLRKYKQYLITSELYIHYTKGWSSFRPLGEHLSEYKIENGEINVSYDIGFCSGRTETKKIEPKDMEELLSILDKAIKIDALEISNTLFQSEHGPICTYDYHYQSKSGSNCGRLLIDDTLDDRYQNLIEKIIK